MYFGEEGEGVETGRSPVQWAFLMGSAAVMLVGIINMFGVEAMAQAAAATLVN
jgi:NADH-quinone oxidoreductase subunit N